MTEAFRQAAVDAAQAMTTMGNELKSMDELDGRAQVSLMLLSFSIRYVAQELGDGGGESTDSKFKWDDDHTFK